jgi:CelD/BcsL family acetyltransferase involved in cellulose biosynthesis
VSLSSRITPLADLTDRDLAAWRDLATRAVEPNPFFEPEFLLPAAAALAPGEVSLAIVEDAGGTWTGAAPVRRVRRWRKLRIPTLELWTNMYSGLEVPLVDRDAVGPGVEALVVALRGRGTPLVAMTQIPADGPYAAALGEAIGAEPLVVDRYERAALRRRTEPTYLLEAMSKKRRHELARLRRGLEKDHEVVSEDRGGDPAAVEDFLRLEASGWKGREGTALASDPAHADFFREMCAGFAASGRLEMLSLSADGEVIAMKCHIRSGDRIFTLKMAFDEEWSKWSPGRLLDTDAMEHFHDHTDAQMMDSIAHPQSEYMNAIWPDRLRLCTMLVPGRGVLGWAAGRAVAATISLRAARARTPVPGPAAATTLLIAAAF